MQKILQKFNKYILLKAFLNIWAFKDSVVFICDLIFQGLHTNTVSQTFYLHNKQEWK